MFKDTKRSDQDYYGHIEPSGGDVEDDKVSVDQSSGESKKQLASISIVKTYGPAAPVHRSDDDIIDEDENEGVLDPRHESTKVTETHISSSQTIHHNSHIPRNTSTVIHNFNEEIDEDYSNAPKVINTVSVSVSDQHGKKLNLSLANILAENQQRHQKLIAESQLRLQEGGARPQRPQRQSPSFDNNQLKNLQDENEEVDDSEVDSMTAAATMLEPSILDVPKIKTNEDATNNKDTSNSNNRKINSSNINSTRSSSSKSSSSSSRKTSSDNRNSTRPRLKTPSSR